MDNFGSMDFHDLKENALTKLSDLQKLIEQDDILVVPTTVCSDGFASRSTVKRTVLFALNFQKH